MRNLAITVLAITVLAVPRFPALAQQDDSSLLTVEKILSAGFRAKSFGPVVWSADGASYTLLEELEESDTSDGARDVVRYDAETGGREVVVPAWRLILPGESSPIEIESYSWSPNGSKLLISTNRKQMVRGSAAQDYWVLDLLGWNWHKLGRDAAPQSLQTARFSPEGRRVSYIKDNDIYVEDLTSFEIIRLTTDGAERLFNGRSKSANTSMLNRQYGDVIAGKGGYAWSPDGKLVAYVQSDWSDVPDFYMINNTETLYPEIIKFPYVKVGQKMASFRVGVVASGGGETNWLDLLADPHEDYLWRMDWAASSSELVLQIMNRRQNTLRVLLADVPEGAVRSILVETDSAWVEPNNIYWLDGGEAFTFVSERDGWSHVYLYSRTGRELGLLTPGPFDVIVIQGIDEEEGWLYYMASPDNATQRFLFRVPLDGSGTSERITPMESPGTHRYQVSPDFNWAIHTFSTKDTPPEVDLIRIPDHRSARVLEDNTELRQKLAELEKSPTDFFRVPIGDGVELDGFSIKPSDFDPQQKYPLFFYIYGEPAGQTVLDSWAGTRYLWHLMLTQQGYVVMSVDPRGTSAPRGRNWRKSIYRQLGIVAAKDHSAATREILATTPYLDPERVGIYGHSGGGQMSLNLIFRYPDLYKLAMPSSFVSHQRFYHPGYQERFMGLIDENMEGYENGSPITWAHRLEGNLLIIHGSGDSNVHYQSFESLVNELVAHKKQFSMMVYPNRNHGLREGRNTQDHLYNLRTDFLHRFMPPGPKVKMN